MLQCIREVHFYSDYQDCDYQNHEPLCIGMCDTSYEGTSGTQYGHVKHFSVLSNVSISLQKIFCRTLSYKVPKVKYFRKIMHIQTTGYSKIFSLNPNTELISSNSVETTLIQLDLNSRLIMNKKVNPTV